MKLNLVLVMMMMKMMWSMLKILDKAQVLVKYFLENIYIGYSQGLLSMQAYTIQQHAHYPLFRFSSILGKKNQLKNFCGETLKHLVIGKDFWLQQLNLPIIITTVRSKTYCIQLFWQILLNLTRFRASFYFQTLRIVSITLTHLIIPNPDLSPIQGLRKQESKSPPLGITQKVPLR